jgi:hypothetical protein
LNSAKLSATTKPCMEETTLPPPIIPVMQMDSILLSQTVVPRRCSLTYHGCSHKPVFYTNTSRHQNQSTIPPQTHRANCKTRKTHSRHERIVAYIRRDFRRQHEPAGRVVKHFGGVNDGRQTNFLLGIELVERST